MARRPDLKHVKWVTSKGKLYGYFDTGKKKANGRSIYARLPAVDSEGFYASYAAFQAGRTKRAETAYTVARLVHDYEKSLFFTQRAEGTKQLYRLTNNKIIQHLGEYPVDDLQREDLLLVLDNEISGAASHNIFVAVLGILYTFARRSGKTSLDPTKDIPKMETGEHAAWPEHVVEAGLESEDARTRLAVHLLYFTGQRIGDVVKMRWSDIRNGEIFVTPQKTLRKKNGPRTLRIRIHSELAAELGRTAKKGLTILTNGRGGAVSDDVVRRELKAHAAKFGVKAVPHGLRKNAVIALLEAGATVAETAAITDQTFAIVEYYSRQVDQARLGSAAILKLENKRGTGKPSGKRAEKAKGNNARG